MLLHFSPTPLSSSCLGLIPFFSSFLFLSHPFTMSVHVFVKSLILPFSIPLPCFPLSFLSLWSVHFLSSLCHRLLSLLSVSIPSFSSLSPSVCLINAPPPKSLSLPPPFVPTSPLSRSMVGCVSCVWTRPRKLSARPWGSSCSRRWSCSMPTRARSRCRPRRSTSASCRSWSRRCRYAGLTWNKRCGEGNSPVILKEPYVTFVFLLLGHTLVQVLLINTDNVSETQ